jgi:uncharacterized protein (DUF983 family)
VASDLYRNAWRCACPRCGEGRLFKSRYTLDVAERCDKCGLELAKNDSGDGPAVFLIFILGFSLVPLALITDALFAPPVWVHAIIWTLAALGICALTLRPAKALTIGIQFKYRPQDWES